jgi:uncharacterized protein
VNDDTEDYRILKFVQSRIPALDALEAFVPDGTTPDEPLEEMLRRSSSSRWYPVEGGHRVLILYEGGGYDAARFTLIPGAWDHEHCTRCGANIEPMTLCWVTENGPFVLLDEECIRSSSVMPIRRIPVAGASRPNKRIKETQGGPRFRVGQACVTALRSLCLIVRPFRRCLEEAALRKRLRKKLHRGEFRELAFPIEFRLVTGLAEAERNAFLDRLIAAVEARGLSFMGAGNGSWSGVIGKLRRGSANEEDRVYIEGFLRDDAAVGEFTIGPLLDAWYGEW